MPGMQFSTDSVSEGRKIDFWRDAVCDTFVELECDTPVTDHFFGSMVNSTVGDLQYSNIRSSAQHVVRTRSKISGSRRDYFLVSLQMTGQCAAAQDGKTAVLSPGDFVLYDTTRPYDLRFDSSFDQLVLRLPRAVVTDRLAEAERYTGIRILGNAGSGHLASHFLRQLHGQIDTIDPCSVGRLHATAVDLLATALSEQAGAVSRISEPHLFLRQKICAFIDANLADPNLHCNAIAGAHGVSQRYLRKLFESASMTVSERIWSRRLEQAKRDLADPLMSNVSVTTIGYDVGFKDAAHFSRSFKTRFGCTPTSWRAEAMVSRTKKS
jgi:AraC-like DNA-binding protein